MLKITHRGGGPIGLIIFLLVMQGVCALIYSAVLGDEANSAYALIGYVLPAGGVLLVMGAISAITVGELISHAREPQTRLYLGLEMPAWCNTASLIALAVVVSTLASMADNFSAGDSVRLWGWIPFSIFIAATTFFAALANSQLEELTGSRNSWWVLRWAFALSFAYLPLSFHFELSGLTMTLPVLVGQVLLGLYLMFDWRLCPRKHSVPATAAAETPPQPAAEQPSTVAPA